MEDSRNCRLGIEWIKGQHRWSGETGPMERVPATLPRGGKHFSLIGPRV